MPLEVDLEVALGGEAIAADVALVRPLTGVAPDMDLQCRVGPKHFATIATPVFKKWFPFFLVLFLTNTEVSQIVGQQALTSIVKYSLSPLL